MRFHCQENIFSLEDFLHISARLNYQLQASQLNPRALLSLLLSQGCGGETCQILLSAIEYLLTAYEHRKRNLGSPAVLHPLRTAAILARFMEKPSILDYLGALLHDKEEDLIKDRMTGEQWLEAVARFEKIKGSIDSAHNWLLMERIDLLTRRENQSYCQYLGLIMEKIHIMPDLLHVKLADRIDNTFDTNLQQPTIESADFFHKLFDLLFVPGFKGVKFNDYHFLPSQQEGAMLLSQLFKNAIVMSVLRQAGADNLDEVTSKLFKSLALASMTEAQWIAIEVLGAGTLSVENQREIVLDIRAYCQNGGINEVTTLGMGHPLDGSLEQYFAITESCNRKAFLAEIYHDHERLLQYSVVMTTIFSCFLHDPSFYIQGISSEGVKPKCWDSPAT